jgi:hypothetical protein
MRTNPVRQAARATKSSTVALVHTLKFQLQGGGVLRPVICSLYLVLKL